ncbi:hypothetical protein N2152v2_004891 [Parachlorella kessleri]
MERKGGAGPLDGSLETLPSQVKEIIAKARASWLKNPEVVDILENFRHYRLAVSSEPPVQPAGGTLYLFNRKECRFFRKDGHNWRKKADGKTVRETHEKLKVGNEEVLNCYYAHADQDDGLQRRCYWLLNEAKEHIVLVHYLNCSSSRAAPPHPIQQGSVNDLAALQQARPPAPQQAGLAAVGGGSAMPGSVGLVAASRQGGERQGQRGQQRRAAEGSGLGGSPPGQEQEQEQAGGGYDRGVGGVASAAGGLARRARRPSSGGLGEGELELSGSLQQQGGPSGALDGHPSLADLQALSPGGSGLPSLAAGQLGGLHPHYAVAAAAAARAQAQQALGGPLPGNQGGFSFPSHHAWQPWFQEYGQQRQRGFEGAPELRAAAAGGGGPGPGAPFGRASPPQDHRSPGLLAGAGLSQQPGMFGPQNGLPPHARSLLQSLSLGTDGDPQRLFPQMSLGLSRYNPEGSICQFLAELEQSLEHHQAQQLSSSAAAQQPQQAQQRPSSMMYRLLQQWSEYSGTSLGSSLGLAQQAQQQERGPDQAAAAANRALLSQVEAVLAALPGAAQHAQQARQAPSWRQPQLDIPPLDMALAGGSAPGGLGSDQGMPDWKNLFRLMSTAASAQGRAALLEGLSGDHSFAAAQQQQLQRPASASDAGAILARLRQKQAQQGASPRQEGIPEGDEQEQSERVGEGGGSRGAGGAASMAAEGVGSGAERSLPLRAEGVATVPRSASPGGGPETAAGDAGPAGAFHAQDRAAAAQQAQQLAAWQRLLEKQESFAQRPAAGTAGPAAGRAAAADGPPRPASRQGQQQRPSSDNPPLHAQAAARFGGTGAIQGRADALAAAAAALGHDRREAALQQARFQRRLSMETDTSVPTMIEQLGGGSLVEEAWVQQHPPPHTRAPQGAAAAAASPPHAAAAAGEAGTAGGKEASLRSLRREMSIDTPQQAPHLHHPPRQEGSAAGLGGLASPESSNASQLHALALIRQLNDLKDQVIQHLVESGTVGSDVIEQLVSTTRGTSATTISQPHPQPSQQQQEEGGKAEQEEKLEVKVEPPNEDEGRRVGGVKEEGCSGGGNTLPADEGEEQQQQQDGPSGAAGGAGREQVPHQESQGEPMDSDESPQAAAQQASPGSPPPAPGRDAPSLPGHQPREQALPNEEKEQRPQQELGPQEPGQQQPGLQEPEQQQQQEATGSAAVEESLQGGEAMAVEAAKPGQAEGLGDPVDMPLADEAQVQPQQQEEAQQAGQPPQPGEQTGAPSTAPALSRLPQPQPGSLQVGQQAGQGQGQEQVEGVHGREATCVDGEAVEHAEVGFVITDFTPSWDFVQGGSKMIITGTLSGRIPPGSSPSCASAKSVEDVTAPPAPLSVWFGSRRAVADQVIPGVLRCTIPPAPLPGTVTLRVAATSPKPALPFEAVDKEGGGSVFEYRADVALLAQQ